MGSLPIPAPKAARLRVLEVAKVICFLQGHLVRVRIRVRVRVRVRANPNPNPKPNLALAGRRKPAHDVIPWPDRWAWRHLTRRGQLVAVHVRVVPLVEAGIVRAQRPLTLGLGLGLANVSGL